MRKVEGPLVCGGRCHENDFETPCRKGETGGFPRTFENRGGEFKVERGGDTESVHPGGSSAREFLTCRIPS